MTRCGGSEPKAFLTQSENVQQNIPNGLEYIGWKNIVKPNFTFSCYKEGVTTSPVMLKRLLTELSDRARKVSLIESNGENNVFTDEEAFKGHGMQTICKELCVNLINLSKEVKVEYKNCFRIKLTVLSVHLCSRYMQ